MIIVGWVVCFFVMVCLTFLLLIALRFGGLDIGPLKGTQLIVWALLAIACGGLWWMLFQVSPFVLVAT